MNRSFPVTASTLATCFVIAAVTCTIAACHKGLDGDGAPPPAKVITVHDMNLVTIPDADRTRFQLATVGQMDAPDTLDATGSVFPDVSREVPVISLANGRVVDIKARLDDNVKKGQLLLKIQSPDITNAFDTYLKAVNDEQMANRAYLRSLDLFQHGAISQSTLEQANDTEKDARADLNAAEDQLKTLGVDKAHPSSIVNVYAPISGVIVAQNVTDAAAAGIGLAGSATAFTIADLSHVWIICDVYENDIPRIAVGQAATIRLNAFPDKPLRGFISDIGPILDPSIRTAKVRVEVQNPGFMRLGMFATATFTSRLKEVHAVVPSQAVLHLHDRNWVFIPSGDDQFRRVEVRVGDILSGGRQEILAGISPGQHVVSDALMLETVGSQ